MAGNGVYQNFMKHLVIDPISWTASDHDILLCLLGNTAPTSSHEKYTNLAGELAETGNYTQCTQQIAANLAAITVSTNTTYFPTATPYTSTWSAATFDAYYVATCHGTAKNANNALISYHNLTGPKSVASGTFTITWNSTGVLYSSVAEV